MAETGPVRCACGELATANGRECPGCFRARLGTVGNHFTPTRTHGTNPTAQQRWDRRLESYRTARMEGIQPATTRQSDIDAARMISDHTQEAFDAGPLATATSGVV